MSSLHPVPEIAGGYPGVPTELAAGTGARVVSMSVGRAPVLQKAPGPTAA
jgi:hypothetical protein